MVSVSIHRAVVRSGRLLLDEPTDLPEGEVVELQDVDPYAHLDAKLEIDPEERRRLNAAIRKGVADIDAGKGIDAEDFVDEIDVQ